MPAPQELRLQPGLTRAPRALGQGRRERRPNRDLRRSRARRRPSSGHPPRSSWKVAPPLRSRWTGQSRTTEVASRPTKFASVPCSSSRWSQIRRPPARGSRRADRITAIGGKLIDDLPGGQAESALTQAGQTGAELTVEKDGNVQGASSWTTATSGFRCDTSPPVARLTSRIFSLARPRARFDSVLDFGRCSRGFCALPASARADEMFSWRGGLGFGKRKMNRGPERTATSSSTR